MTYSEQDDGALVSLRQGETFQTHLPENPTTGYRWRLDEWDSVLLEAVRDEYRPLGIPAVGAGGEHIWEFVAHAPGTVHLRFHSARSWENAEPAKSFSLHVVIS